VREGATGTSTAWRYVDASFETVTKLVSEMLPEIYRSVGCTVTPVPGMENTYLERFNAEGFDSAATLISIGRTRTRGTRVTIKVAKTSSPDLELTEAQASALAGASASLMLNVIQHLSAEIERAQSPGGRQLAG
jgi:hypothetical protein